MQLGHGSLTHHIHPGPRAPSPKEESSSHPDGALGMGLWGQAPQEGPTYQSGYSESGFRATSGLSLW